MIATVIYSAFAGWQLYEIHSGAKDTHDLAVAAGKQADKMKDMSGAADKIRQAAEGMVLQEKQIADNAKEAMDTSNRQAKAALDASIAASRSDQRAYVTIGRPDGTVADIIWPKDEKGNAGLMVYFQNNGRLPAKFNWGSQPGIIEMVPADPTVTAFNGWNGQWTELDPTRPFQPMYRARDKKTKSIYLSGAIDIAGGSSYQGILLELPKDRMLQLLNNTDRMISERGDFEYCDGFGKRVCKQFDIQWAKEPYSRFFLIFEDECPATEMQIMHPIPDYEYLSACVPERPEMKRFIIPGLPNPQ
jgi:hypothetical protein